MSWWLRRWWCRHFGHALDSVWAEPHLGWEHTTWCPRCYTEFQDAKPLLTAPPKHKVAIP